MWLRAIVGAAAAVWLGAAGCGGSMGSAPAGTCAHASDCGPDALCVCPGGARSCATGSVCLSLCRPGGDGVVVCPSGGACVDEVAACCQGQASCTLNCLHQQTCAR